MKEIVIISGKGGTGKTSITASFAAFGGNIVLADCDVDAADLHLLLRPEIKEQHRFFSGNEAVIDNEKCSGCGKCHSLCRFGAVKYNKKTASFEIDSTLCEGCGVCFRFCPEKAISFPERDCGNWFHSTTRFGEMIHARLGIGAENSGKLVSQVRNAARETASGISADIILIDGPPGTGCPVIASITGADGVIIITEPTLSGKHDLMRVMKLVNHFGIPAFVCVNKWDINPEISSQIEDDAVKSGAVFSGKIPYDDKMIPSQISEQSLVEYDPFSKTSLILKEIWNRILDLISENSDGK